MSRTERLMFGSTLCEIGVHGEVGLDVGYSARGWTVEADGTLREIVDEHGRDPVELTAGTEDSAVKRMVDYLEKRLGRIRQP